MRIDARAFRGVLEVLQAFSATGQLISGSNFCRLSKGDGCVMATLPTPAGWIRVQVQAVLEPSDPDVLGLDLLLFRRTLRGVVWPRTGSAGEVELVHTAVKGMLVRVPMWSKGRGTWVEGKAKEFVYPPTEMVFWPQEALPACSPPPDKLGSRQIVTTSAVWQRVVDGVERSTASGQEKPNLRNVQVLFREDEVVAVATDGGQAALCSESTAQILEQDLRVNLPAEAVRAVTKVLTKAKATEDPLHLRLVTTDGKRGLHIRMEAAPIELLLRLPEGGPPADTLEQLPITTSQPAGVITDPGRFIADLGLAGWNPGARVVWFVWGEGHLSLRSHAPLLDTRFQQPLEGGPTQMEVAVDQARLNKAVEQLRGMAAVNALSLFVDNTARPRRLLIRAIEDGGERVMQMVLMATATTGYMDFRAKALKLAESEARRRRLHAPDWEETPATVPSA